MVQLKRKLILNNNNMQKLLLFLICLPQIVFPQTFWSENFSNGIPPTWINSNIPWEYRGPTTTPNINTGCQGFYGYMAGPIVSSTFTNGFIIFDSDYHDNNGTPNIGSGPYPAPHSGTLMTDPIDLSPYANVTLKMNSFYANYISQLFINFYVNGVYNSSLQLHSNIPANFSNNSNDVISVIVPNSVVGNSNVQIEFEFNGDGVFWMIDDIILEQSSGNSIDIIDVSNNGLLSQTEDEYTYQPIKHALANPYNFEMVIANTGLNNQTGVQFHVEVYDSLSNQVFSSSSTPVTLNSTDTNLFITNQQFTASNIGIYTMYFWATSDSISSSDTILMSSVITDTIYGKNYDQLIGYQTIGKSCGVQQIASPFEFYAVDSLSSISVYLDSSSTVPGAKMYGVLYKVDTTAGLINPFTPISQTVDHTVQSYEFGYWISMSFDSIIHVDPQYGILYAVAIGGYAHPTDSIGVGISGMQSEGLKTGTWYIEENCLGAQSGWYGVDDIARPMILINSGEIYGCTDTLSCTYNPLATMQSTCVYDLTYSYSTSACDSFFWGVNGTTYTTSGVYQEVFPLASGCDSIQTLTLWSVNNSATFTDVQYACGPYTWIDGVTYTSSNDTAIFVGFTQWGCDSVVTLDLTISSPDTSIDVQQACDSYTWMNGVTYTSSNNTAMYLSQAVTGCDSIIKLDLTITNSNTSIDFQQACDSLIWIDGITYTSSNNSATFTYANASGCDSIVTLDLIIDTTSSSTDIHKYCKSFTWIDGVKYTASNNTATQLYTNVNGCDSIVKLDLTIYGDPVVQISQSGLFLQTSIVNGTAPYSYFWNNGAIAPTINPTTNGWYWCFIKDANDCLSDTTFFEVTNIISNTYENNNSIKRLIVYPNPSADIFNINFTSTQKQDITISIINVIGEEIFNDELSWYKGHYRKEIDLTNKAKGIYFLDIETDNGVINKRLILN